MSAYLLHEGLLARRLARNRLRVLVHGDALTISTRALSFGSLMPSGHDVAVSVQCEPPTLRLELRPC
jgi:hypothetical protein